MMNGHPVRGLIAVPRDVAMSGRSVDECAGAPPPPCPIAFTPARRPPVETFRRLEDCQFRMMEAAFDRTGGCVAEKVVANRWRRKGQPQSSLADRIRDRSIVSFPWRSRTLVPLFQFVPGDLAVRQEMAEVVRELVDVFDRWELALWFAQPNTWLVDAAPVDLIARDHAAVIRAARADRFIARG